jgi:hypothetical protein
LKTIGGLKPAAFVRDVSIDEILIALCEVDDAFNEADDAANAASAYTDYDLNDSFLGVAEDEFMDTKSADQNAADSGGNFLFRSSRSVAHEFLSQKLFTTLRKTSQLDFDN